MALSLEMMKEIKKKEFYTYFSEDQNILKFIEKNGFGLHKTICRIRRILFTNRATSKIAQVTYEYILQNSQDDDS